MFRLNNIIYKGNTRFYSCLFKVNFNRYDTFLQNNRMELTSRRQFIMTSFCMKFRQLTVSHCCKIHQKALTYPRAYCDTGTMFVIAIVTCGLDVYALSIVMCRIDMFRYLLCCDVILSTQFTKLRLTYLVAFR